MDSSTAGEVGEIAEAVGGNAVVQSVAPSFEARVILVYRVKAFVLADIRLCGN